MSEQEKKSDVGLIALVAAILGALLLAGGGGALVVSRQKAQRSAEDEQRRVMEETQRALEAEMDARRAATSPSGTTPK